MAKHSFKELSENWIVSLSGHKVKATKLYANGMQKRKPRKMRKRK